MEREQGGYVQHRSVNLASSIVIAMRRTIVAVNDDRPPSRAAALREARA